MIRHPNVHRLSILWLVYINEVVLETYPDFD
jgi:hypothetical protein